MNSILDALFDFFFLCIQFILLGIYFFFLCIQFILWASIVSCISSIIYCTVFRSNLQFFRKHFHHSLHILTDFIYIIVHDSEFWIFFDEFYNCFHIIDSQKRKPCIQFALYAFIVQTLLKNVKRYKQIFLKQIQFQSAIGLLLKKMLICI